MSINLRESGASSEIKKDGYELNLTGIESWLKDKKVLNKQSKLNAYKDVDVWHRSGAETYLTVFEINIDNDVIKKIVLKAIVTTPLEKSLGNWSNRRNILFQKKIPVSKWYWWGEGIIIEDFYPFSHDKVSNFNIIIDIASKLDNLGFSALNFLADIRCDEKLNPFYIDFGFDLGDTSNVSKSTCIDFLKKQYPTKEAEIVNYLKIHNSR